MTIARMKERRRSGRNMNEYWELMETKEGQQINYHLNTAIKLIRQYSLESTWQTIEFRNQFVKYMITELVKFEEIFPEIEKKQ